jgi:hypothetical protein
MFEATDIIHAYSRADAIDEGQLIDVSERAKHAGGNTMGFKVPVAMTSAAWESLVAWHSDGSPSERQQHEERRLGDVLYVAFEAASQQRNERLVEFIVDVLEQAESGPVVVPTHVVMTIGPGDTPEPVITIKLPEED